MPASPTHLSNGQPVWLCRPGLTADPCTANLDYESIDAAGVATEHVVTPARDAAVDCFYVYPTVSAEKTINSNLTIEPQETATARTQASPFSSDCNVWAPMYRQLTLAGLFHASAGTLTALQIAYTSLLGAWKLYLRNDNRGRPFVLIGHSQGAAMLIRLISAEIDPNPALRKRLVAAIILGGNVAVPTGKLVGGTFKHVPVCTSTAETGCVVAYSSFLSPPPADALFGRPGRGVSLLSGQTASAGLRVVCVNPASPGGGTAPLQPLFPTFSSSPDKHWVTYPGLYSASCESSGGATWLGVQVHRSASDHRPVVTEALLGPTWGLHLWDPNMAMLNLVALVRSEIAHFPG